MSETVECSTQTDTYTETTQEIEIEIKKNHLKEWKAPHRLMSMKIMEENIIRKLN